MKTKTKVVLLIWTGLRAGKGALSSSTTDAIVEGAAEDVLEAELLEEEARDTRGPLELGSSLDGAGVEAPFRRALEASAHGAAWIGGRCAGTAVGWPRASSARGVPLAAASDFWEWGDDSL